MTGVELFAIGAYAFTLADAAVAIGAITSVAGALSAGEGEANFHEYNARVAENNAISERRRAAEEANRVEKENSDKISRQINGYLSSGVTMQGTPVVVLANDTVNAEVSRLRALYDGEAAARYYDNLAGSDRLQAREARKAGKRKAGETLLTAAFGIGSAVSDRKQAKQGTPLEIS